MGLTALLILFTAAMARMANVVGWALFFAAFGLIIGLGWLINQF